MQGAATWPLSYVMLRATPHHPPLRRLSLPALTSTPIGQHGGAVRCCRWLSGHGLLLTGGWDACVKAWDPRAPPHQACIRQIGLPGKVYCMSASKEHLVVGTSERHVLIFDLRK